MSALIYRPLRTGEFHLFHRYSNPPTSGVGARTRTFDEFVADGDYRPGWTWVAQRGDDIVARAAFFGPPDAVHPYSLDWFDPGVGPYRIETGAALLRAAYTALAPPDYWAPPHPDGGRPDYHLFLPADWRDRPDAHADVTDRMTAAEEAGLNHFVERVNVRWTPDHGLPARSTRLQFVVPDDAQVVDVLDRMCVDTLDAYAQRDVERHGRRRAAELTLDELADMPGGRDWWRLALDPTGAKVGFVAPTRMSHSATIGYLGVVPEQRGHHYSDDLLVEALHLFSDAGEQVVNDATDVGNAPMVASFARVGYEVTGRRVVMT